MSKTIDSHLIGKTIRALRKARNLTQEDVADQFGCTIRSLRRYENDGITSIVLVNQFAEYFGVSAIDILQ